MNYYNVDTVSFANTVLAQERTLRKCGSGCFGGWLGGIGGGSDLSTVTKGVYVLWVWYFQQVP